jgi:hypothetical protein
MAFKTGMAAVVRIALLVHHFYFVCDNLSRVFNMHLLHQVLLVSASLGVSLAQGGSDPYVPVYTSCPSDLKIRKASDVSPAYPHCIVKSDIPRVYPTKRAHGESNEPKG